MKQILQVVLFYNDAFGYCTVFVFGVNDIYACCQAYGVFTDIHEAVSLEDSVGRVCVRYERFENCDSAWDIIDGEYTLVSDTGSSDTRYEYAQAIYNYFVK